MELSPEHIERAQRLLEKELPNQPIPLCRIYEVTRCLAEEESYYE